MALLATRYEYTSLCFKCGTSVRPETHSPLGASGGRSQVPGTIPRLRLSPPCFLPCLGQQCLYPFHSECNPSPAELDICIHFCLHLSMRAITVSQALLVLLAACLQVQHLANPLPRKIKTVKRPLLAVCKTLNPQ